ncbi:MAG: glycogen-debranching protein [Fibrobacterales bacterium]
MNYYDLEHGRPFPFGASYIPELFAYNFALYSKYSSSVTLHFYHANDCTNPFYSKIFNFIINKTRGTWHCLVPECDIKGAVYYSYEVDGPYEPHNGYLFNPNKVLFDPYAKSLHFPKDYSRISALGKDENYGKAALGELPPIHEPPFDWENDLSPHHAHDLIIYEMHVRGFTQNENSGVTHRGTFDGIREKIPYLKELGITAVELLPIHQYDPQENNYWGYMTMNFFALHHEYCVSDELIAQKNEFKQLVKELHANDIEVILDVVYNHTTEEDHRGPSYSYRGIDNTTYYLLSDDRQYYINDSGTGNVLRVSNRYTRTMVLDSLRYWVEEFHVDGFRFDLAAIFTRNNDGSVNLVDPPLIGEITNDPILANTRLIGEAWDIGSYQLGQDFPGVTWMQWNGKYRDDLRSFVKGEDGMVQSLMTRIYGSTDLFPEDLFNACHPWQSVNFITAHDGFCLTDLVAYNEKHNEVNGNNNTDGDSHNSSWNCGVEGPTDDLVIQKLRKRQIKNFIALLLLSNGTPMFSAGDEFMRTQHGNNNPYNQDTDKNWLDWDLLETNRNMFTFFQNMIEFRKQHHSIGRGRFWREDISWYGHKGPVDWKDNSHFLAYCLHGASVGDSDIYVMINAHWEAKDFSVQEGHAGDWKLVINTALDSVNTVVTEEKALHVESLCITVEERSIIVLIKKPTKPHKIRMSKQG